MPNHTDLPPAAAEPLRRLPEPGRTKFSPEIVQQICGVIRLDGLSDRRAALLAGVSGKTLRQWKNRYPLLVEQLEQARAEFQQARLQKIREVCGRDGAVDWRAQAYLLEKAHLHTGGEEPADEAEGGSDVSPLFVVSPEQLANLQQRRLAALAKMNP